MHEYTTAALVTVADETNLTDAAWENARTHPDDPLLVRQRGTRQETVSAREFQKLVADLAKGLMAAGVSAGDRVALMSRTRFEWTLIDYAIWAAGAVTVPIYETSSAQQAQWILSDSGAVACIVETPQHAVTIAQVRDKLPALRHVWQIDAEPSAEKVLTQLGEAVPDNEFEARRSAVNADDLATVIYTSGTTGRPKGCALTHRNFLPGVANALACFDHEFSPSSQTLMFLPLAHVLARYIAVCAVTARVTMSFCDDPKKLLDAVQLNPPTLMVAVPRVFEKLHAGARRKAHEAGKGRIFDAAERCAIAYSQAMEKGKIPFVLRVKHRLFDRLVYGKIRAVLGGQCTTAISGGAPLGPRLAHFFRGIGVVVYEGYGLTETTAPATVNRRGEIRIGTVGRPMPGTSIGIADDGEILVRGDVVLRGYWGNPSATEETIDEQGWFHTGDLGALNDGYLTVTGRKKEMLVTAGGKNVAPAPLEDRIRRHPLVSQVMVIGDGKPFISALITVDPENFEIFKRDHHKAASATITQLREDPGLVAELQKLVDEANEQVSRAEMIKVFRILAEDFTIENDLLTPSQKVKRSEATKYFATDISSIYGEGNG
ncbi:MAG: long-chain fatty acid--CoA ligase [Corynebacteriales bacterium]|nr:long-chain fatty acid--CoA ligase [Mycobacteriales bacterium]